jgi:hypothetical protein
MTLYHRRVAFNDVKVASAVKIPEEVQHFRRRTDDYKGDLLVCLFPGSVNNVCLFLFLNVLIYEINLVFAT